MDCAISPSIRIADKFVNLFDKKILNLDKVVPDVIKKISESSLNYLGKMNESDVMF